MSDNKKNKQTLVGMGAPTAEEIAADAAEKAAKVTDAVEAKEAEVETEASEAADGATESEDSETEASEPDVNDAKRKKSDDNTHAATTSAKKKKRESEAPKAAAKDDSDDAKADADETSDETSGDNDETSEEEVDDEESRRPALYLAEYETPEALHEAACLVRDEGFEHWDCHTPYAIHGMDEAMGLTPTKIGIISFIHAVIGLVTAVLMIQYTNNWDYAIIVGGKPAGAFAPMVPIMFELTVLLTGFGTLFGLLHLAGLPRHHHPIFESDRFASATDDKFFISIEVKDPNFDLKKTRELLEGTNPSYLELVEEDLV